MCHGFVLNSLLYLEDKQKQFQISHQRSPLGSSFSQIGTWLEEFSIQVWPFLQSWVNVFGTKRISPEHDTSPDQMYPKRLKQELPGDWELICKTNEIYKPVRWETHAHNSSNVKVWSFDCNTFSKDSAGLIHHGKEYHLHNVLFR